MEMSGQFRYTVASSHSVVTRLTDISIPRLFNVWKEVQFCDVKHTYMFNTASDDIGKVLHAVCVCVCVCGWVGGVVVAQHRRMLNLCSDLFIVK